MADFFERQDQAKRHTGRLVVLFTLAVIGIVVAMNAVAFGAMVLSGKAEPFAKATVNPDMQAELAKGRGFGPGRQIKLWNPKIYGLTTLGTLAVIFLGSAYKTASLATGGGAVAQLLGGRHVETMTESPLAPRVQVLRNVVEEMSIASGLPAPNVYVVEDEAAINAFAAGWGPESAVIGVTQGTLEQLNRDQLQGVIAHEFSHILNGDMRLNIRLLGINHGILVIGLIGLSLVRAVGFGAGRHTRRRGKDDGKGALAMIAIGLALTLVGYVGVFFGRLIQAAVSRQREYLADAAAVQFTRNPQGLAGALKIIGGYEAGSKVKDRQADEMAHMFFAQSFTNVLGQLYATHPPLVERIKAIDPTWSGQMEQRGMAAIPMPDAPMTQSGAASGFAGATKRAMPAETTIDVQPLRPGDVFSRVGQLDMASIADAQQIMSRLPGVVIHAAHEPYSARAVVFTLLLDELDPSLRHKQLQAIATQEPPLARLCETLRSALASAGPGTRLPMLDLAMPALSQLSGPQAQMFDKLLRLLIEMDRHISTFEYAVYKITTRHMRQSQEKPANAKFHSVAAVKDDAAVVLVALAGESVAESEPDFAARRAHAFSIGMGRLVKAQQDVAMPQQASLARLDRALDQLSAASGAVKRRILDAAAHTVAADGEVRPAEAELLRAIAATMGVPVPPLLARAVGGGA